MPFTFDTSTRTYYDDAGRKVSDADMRALVAETIDGYRAALRDIAQGFVDGDKNVAALMTEAQQEIKDLYTALALVGYGGKGNMNASEFGVLGANIKEQLGFLNNLGLQLFNEEIPVNGSIVGRLGMYADDGFSMWQNFILDREEKAGVERVVYIASDDGATCEGCADAAGEYDIADCPQPGSVGECLSNCRCWTESVEAQA